VPVDEVLHPPATRNLRVVTSAPLSTSCVVIGAGQAGLSAAYYLRRLGLQPGQDFVIVDRGPRTGGAWQWRWEALRLGSAHRVNDLPGMGELGVSFATANQQAPARDVVAEFYERYEQHYDLQVVRPAAVARVDDLGSDLLVSLHAENELLQVRTSTVINATGTWGSPFVPHYPGLRDFAGRHVHTASYEAAELFAGLDVVVVGAGTSAIGFILELQPHAANVTWATRRPPEWVNEGDLDFEAAEKATLVHYEAALAGRALPSIVSGTGVPRTRRIQAALNRGTLNFRPMFDRIEPDAVVWADGSRQHADVLLWATGFRPELRHLAPLKLREKEGGVAVASDHSVRDARVFFAGYGPAASTIGANRAGRNVARQVVAALSRLGR
jgi:cation diffusion facilitator CzcD-associated flavoprotein CzcO